MKHIIILIIMLTTNIIVSAQSFNGNIILGFNASQVDGDEQLGFKKAGLKGGFTVSVHDEETLSYESGLIFSNRGAKKVENGYTYLKTSFNYSEVPVLWNIKFLDRYYATIGLSYNALMSSRITDATGYVEKNSTFMRDHDANIVAGLKVSFANSLEFRVTYNYSIFCIAEDQNSRFWRNNLLGFTLVKKLSFRN